MISVILAAGKGTRMKSGHSKVLHKVNGVPMIRRVVDVLESIGNKKNVFVFGYKKEDVLAEKKDLYKLMEILGILKEGYDISVNTDQREILKAEYVEASSDGLWYTYFKQGEKIKKGEIIGTLKNIEGDTIQEVEAKFDATILYYTISLGVRKKDTLIAYGSE